MKVHWEKRRLKNHVSCLVLALLLTSMLTAVPKVQPVSASGTIYIRADGSIDPPDVTISTVDNVTYILTGNITSDGDGIVVERDDIVVDGAGCTLQGTGSDAGIELPGSNNVTIRNVTITKFGYGIYVFDIATKSLVFDSQAKKINITGTTYTLPQGVLAWGKKYYWYMNTHNSAGWGSNSSVLYFQTQVPKQ